MTDLIWSVKKLLVKDLKPWKDNPRKISHGALEKLKERIVARGFHDVIKIDVDNTILSGNQRKKVLEDLGVKEVTVIYPNRALTEEERNKVALESNHNDGEWDFEKLQDFKLDTLLDIGFDADLLNSMWAEDLKVKEENFDVEKELEKIKVPETKLGDIIILGNHKLICGSSRDSNILKKLFGEEKASMIYSDPPYNIKLDYNKGIGGKKNYGGDVHDDRSYSEYKQFLGESMISALLVAEPNTHVFYWSDQTYIGLIQELYRDFGIENKRVCLWIKQGQNPTPGVAFNKCYEPCTYGVLGKPYICPNI